MTIELQIENHYFFLVVCMLFSVKKKKKLMVRCLGAHLKSTVTATIYIHHTQFYWMIYLSNFLDVLIWSRLMVFGPSKWVVDPAILKRIDSCLYLN